MSDHPEKLDKFERLRRQAEQLIQQQPDVPFQANVVDLFHEMEVAYKELEIQAEELKRTQNELASLHQEYENLYEFAPCGYLTLNPKGVITRANLTAVSLLEANRSSLYLSTLSSHIAYKWDATFLKVREQAARTGERQSVELLLKRGKDSTIWIQANIQADFDKEGAVAQWRIVLDDITKRKLMEEKLRQSWNFLAEAEKIANVGAWSWDIDKDIWTFSENWLAIHGCGEPPRTIEDLMKIAHPDDLPMIRAALQKSLAEKTRYDIEHRIVHQDTKEVLYVQGFGEVVTNQAGQAIRMYGASMDVTRRKRDQQALEEARKAAEDASKHKSDFLARMSHEIRTPMNSILGMLRLALSGDLPAKQKERVQVARESAESLLWLLNDLLDMSKIEAGRFTLHQKEFRIRHLLNNVCHEIEVLASEKDIKHYLSVGRDLPTVLHGDPYRLKRVLFNLLSNAVKFTKHGWVSLEAELLDLVPSPEDESFNTATVLIKVKDTGKGIGPDELESIFESYNQGGQDSLSSEQGTGLGLAICKNLSEQMGGTIWAESQPGEGSVFYVQLPFKTDGQIMEEPENGGEVVNLPVSSPLNILLVEDQKMNQIFTVDLLSSNGHQVTVAENGQQALDKLGQSSFDLVLMDLRMPVMDGIETTLRIRTADPLVMNPDIPVIGLSAHAVAEQEKQRFQHVGFNEYVVKPVSFEKLFTAMQEVLGSGRDEDQPKNDLGS
jgi:signal transduction histidine kinase/ActR/RegA family two-component response regulator